MKHYFLNMSDVAARRVDQGQWMTKRCERFSRFKKNMVDRRPIVQEYVFGMSEGAAATVHIRDHDFVFDHFARRRDCIVLTFVHPSFMAAISAAVVVCGIGN